MEGVKKLLRSIARFTGYAFLSLLFVAKMTFVGALPVDGFHTSTGVIDGIFYWFMARGPLEKNWIVDAALVAIGLPIYLLCRRMIRTSQKNAQAAGAHHLTSSSR
jgi:hypothetical protein